MMIKDEACTGCGTCSLYCPVEAIVRSYEETPKGKKKSRVDLERCVECGNCLRASVCPVDAVYQQPLEWPRTIRSAFSNPLTVHKETNLMGRGTEEMKTNEITHRIGRGLVGVGLELGRPGMGTSMHDLDLVTRTVARLGVEFEEQTPLTGLMADRSRGILKEEILGERVLSAIVEFKIGVEKLPEVLVGLKDVAAGIDTVFSLGVMTLLPQDGLPDPLPAMIRNLGFSVRPNGKVNLGLGRPENERSLE